MSNLETYADLYDRDFLNKFGDKSEEIGQIPFDIQHPAIDLSKIADILDVNIKESDLKVKDGYVKRSDRNITINENISEGRKRFTIAHELGHYISNGTEDVFYRGAESYDGSKQAEEREANSFAAELLMPNKKVLTDLMKRELVNIGSNPSRVSEFEIKTVIAKIAKLLQVSSQALEYRYINLNILRRI